MSKKNDIGSHLREIREAKGISQGQLADLVNVSRQTINYIENETYCPSTKVALQLAHILQTTVETIFYLKGSDRVRRVA